MRSLTQHLVAASLSLSCVWVGAAEQGHFGFSVSVDADGFLDPILKGATVAKVNGHSPAQRAGLRPGDQILQIEGRDVVGSKAKEMQALMRLEVGQPLMLLVKRAQGELVSVETKATKR